MAVTRRAGRVHRTTGGGTNREVNSLSHSIPRLASEQQTYRAPNLDERTLLEFWLDEEAFWRQALAKASPSDPRRIVYAELIATAERGIARETKAEAGR